MIFSLILLQVGEQTQNGVDPKFIFMMVALIAVFYFFMIRPQTKRQKELKNFRDALQKGDKVVTNGGIYGKISHIGEQTVDVEIASGVTIKIDKFAILKDNSDLVAQK